MTGTSRLALRAAALSISLLIAAGLGEAALRVWYRDGGRRTLGGPGGRTFLQETIDGELRGRRDTGPKAPGVPRIMIVGDSITYGLGVRDWRQTWPELLARKLEQAGRPHEMAVFAFRGQDMPQHVNVMREWDARTAPDVFVYQWYVNDIEAVSHRPDQTRAWQRWSWHQTLRDHSYLYFVLDHRLSQFLPSRTRSYIDYLRTDFVPGTIEWTEFEREFHEFATRAAHAAPRRLMALYPQVPFSGRYPLQALHDRMRTLAGPHNLEIPPVAWVRSGGTIVADAAAVRGLVFSVPPDSPTSAIETLDYVFEGGPLEVVTTLKKVQGEGADDAVAALELIDAADHHVLQETALRVAGPAGSLVDVISTLTVPGNGLRHIRFRVRSAGRAGWALANIRMPVDYGFEVVDLTDALNAFPTHASAFDAHPNEAAHAVMADVLYKALTASRPPRP